MFKEIVARQPDSKPDLRGLALALARMGSIEMHENQLESSLQHYQRALDIDSRLYLRDTTDVQNRLNKGWAHNNYGLILNRLGRHNDALAQFSAARPFFESVSSADDSDVRSKTLLETNHARTADSLFATNPQEQTQFKALREQLFQQIAPFGPAEEVVFEQYAYATFQALRAQRFESEAQDR